MVGQDPDYVDMLRAEADYWHWHRLAETRGIALAQVEALAAELVEKTKAEIEMTRRETAQVIEDLNKVLEFERYRTSMLQAMLEEAQRRSWWHRLIG